MKAWVARDKNGALYMYTYLPPEKCRIAWQPLINIRYCYAELIEDSEEFKNVKWEDEKPTEVEIIIKIKSPE